MEKKFRIFSILFIVGCIIFYGVRFSYYYIKFNKNSKNNDDNIILANQIKKQDIVTKDDGLYNIDGELVYRGKNVDNYLLYSNILFRIVRVNTDNTVTLVTDSKLTDLAFSNNTDFSKSYINDWLNENDKNTGIFESKLNDKNKYLTTNTICLDQVDDLKNITCRKKDISKFVSIIGIGDYLNSKLEDSYMNNTDSMWLYNTKKDKKVWYIKNGNLSNDLSTSIHGVKAVITLKNSIKSISGSGQKNDPYLIDMNDKIIKFNSYVKLGNDLYNVYDMNDKTIKLVKESLINDSTSRNKTFYNKDFNSKQVGNIANYLNNTYYNKLTYKNILADCEFNIGDLNSKTNYDYKNIYTKKVTAKVGLLSLLDINLNNELTEYFYLNKIDNKIYSINDDNLMNYSTNKIRPTVCIDSKLKLKGNGTRLNPFTIEVE